MARAVTEMARRAKLRLARPTQFHEVAGKGVDAEIEGIRVLVGRASWLSDPTAGLDAASIAAIDEIQRSSEADGLSVLYVVKEGRLAGWIGLEDNARPEAAGAVERLVDASGQLALRVLNAEPGQGIDVAHAVGVPPPVTPAEVRRHGP